MAVREQWLEKRHQMILPMMRQFNIDMWIVVNEEFHDDPLTNTLPRPSLRRWPRHLHIRRYRRERFAKNCHCRIRRRKSETLLRVA